MHFITAATVAVLTLMSAYPCSAAEPDFYLMMKKCSTTVGYLVFSDDSLKTVEGTPIVNTCARSGRRITCDLSFVDGGAGSKGSTATYTVTLDSPPKLIFTDEVASDWFMVDTAKHAVVMITRLVDQEFAGAKVCYGLFATKDEMDALRREKKP